MRGAHATRPGFCLVMAREFKWLLRRPLLLSLTTVVPLALMALLTLIFSAGLATRLPIAALDLDQSDLSRTIIRMVDATPDAAVAVRVTDLSEARQKIISGEVYGVLFLPRNLERDLDAGRRPEVVFFYNSQAMTPGNMALRGINSTIPALSASVRLSMRAAHGEPIEAAMASVASIPVQTHALFNPTLNYAHFLLAALLPAVLQIAVATALAYSVGLDAGTAHRLRVLRRLGGGLRPALAGKLVPYLLIFLLVLGASDAVLFQYLGLPIRGDRAVLLGAAILFILSCELLGAFLALVARQAAIGLATLLTGPAFGFMGIGFPRQGMNDFAYGWGELLPGTWYLMARIDQTIRGTPLDLSLHPIAVLLIFVAGLSLLIAARLTAISRNARGTTPQRLLQEAGR